MIDRGKRIGHELTRRRLLTTAGVGGASVFLAGCTGEEPEDDTPGQETGEGTITYVTTITPSTIDPMGVSDNLENIVTVNLYDSLLNYTTASPPELTAGLAEDWTVGDDDRTYTFSLREDATFHDGDPVTAEDVAFSFERMQTMQRGHSWMWADTVTPEGVDAVDDTTVEIMTERTFAPFLFTLPYHPIVNASRVEEHARADGEFDDHGDYGTEWLEDNDAGSGAYALAEHDREQRIVLERNDDWWGSFPDEGEPFEEVIVEMVPEEATATGMLRNETADLTDEWLSLESYEDLDALDHVRVSSEVTFSPLYVFMHNGREPLDDPDVRRAISHALDYEAVVDDVLAGESERLEGPLPSDMWGHNDDVTVYDYDLDAARSYLDEASYDPGEIELTYTYVTGLTTTENIGLLLQTNLGELGIDLEIDAEPWSRITDMATSRETTSDMHAIYLSFSYVDPDTFLYPTWHSSSHGSWEGASWYENDEVDDLLDRAREEINVDERERLYEEAQTLIVDDAPALFVVNEAERYGVNERVGGFVDNGLVGYPQAFWRLYQQG